VTVHVVALLKYALYIVWPIEQERGQVGGAESGEVGDA
jgi:hypothetical protein